MLGNDLRDRLAVRRSAAARLVDGDGDGAAARIESAPPGYLLAHGSSDIARQCELLTPLPAPYEVRAVATPTAAAGEWHLDVGSRDRPGLLAAFTGVLAAAGLDVVQAVLATWDDGGALEAFVVRAAGPPDCAVLQPALEASLLATPSSPPMPEAEVVFHDRPGALYTCCDVTAPDRPGLLHAVATAIATAGADVHAARVTTADGRARDRFDLSDRLGRRLSPVLEDAIRRRVIEGVHR